MDMAAAARAKMELVVTVVTGNGARVYKKSGWPDCPLKEDKEREIAITALRARGTTVTTCNSCGFLLAPAAIIKRL
jgi:hypothetical protein